MAAGLLGQQPQQQNIPDAPKPQTVPTTLPLGGVAPGKGASSSTPSAPATEQAVPTQPADPNQPAVGSTLPESPAGPVTSDAQATHDNGGEAPIDNGGPNAFLLPTLQVNFVEVPFTVKDSKGQLVPGLTWRDVRVYENGKRQQMKVFTRDPFPLSVAVVIDQSMTHDAMTRVNNALGALQSAFSSYDEVAVFTYNNGPRLETNFTAGQSARLGAVIERSSKAPGRDAGYYAQGEGLGSATPLNINNGYQNNQSPLSATVPGSPGGISRANVPVEIHTLNDAIFEAAKSLSKVESGRRRIIYVISDGKEYGSIAKQKDVIKYLQTNQISVFATLTGDENVKGLGFLDKYHLPLMMRDNVLPAYTGATGGAIFADFRTKGIEESFAKVTEQVRTQYTVGYNSQEAFIDGKYRKVEVQIMRPNLNVIAKDGYYPSAPQNNLPQRQRTSNATSGAPVPGTAAPSTTAPAPQ